jgi:class 3 adenylate cyclase
MGQKKKPVGAFVASLLVFIGCVLVCFFNQEFLKQPIFNRTTEIINAASAKYEKDGNLYIIDSGSFRLICMRPDGRIKHTITVDKMKEYTRIYDSTVDDKGNLYIYAMEVEYDAYLTKRDMIRMYDSNGKFVKEILSIDYSGYEEDRPRGFAQFGSMHCNDGMLTFSRIRKDHVVLYSYDVFRDKLSSSVFFAGTSNYSIARLTLKDFRNFVYSTRGGDIYEVRNGETPRLRASFDFILDEGGVIPWDLDYGKETDIIFFDMAAGSIFRLDQSGKVTEIIPRSFFDDLTAQGKRPTFTTGFGAYDNHFSGVYGYVVWYYDGYGFRTYEEAILAEHEFWAIAAVQFSLVLGILAFLAGMHILFKKILEGFISLFIKQTVIIIPLTIAAFIIFYIVTSRFMTERLNQEIFNELRFAATMGAELINGDDLDALKSIKDYESETYQRLSGVLKRIVGNNQSNWNQGYYAAIYIGSRFEYWVAISSDEVSLFRFSNYFDEVSDPKEVEAFMNGETIASIVSAIDGQWAWSEAPIYNSKGEINGMVELALDMTSYQTRSLRERRDISIIAAIICLAILLALMGVLSIIIHQLMSVVGVLSAIAGGNYAARVRYRGRDELGMVTNGLNTMAGELQKQIDRINNMTESTIRFVPLQFMEHLGVTDITKMKLGDNVQRNFTVLFFDIRAFSVNSEIMSVAENFVFINKVLGIAGPIIRANNGFVDKYLGDAVMALFVNAVDAVRAGITVYKQLILDKDTRVKIGGDSINIGVGIHTGSVMMGIVGENERLSSTVISKNVNMASRLESLTKQTKSGMLISRDTMNGISGYEKEFQYRFIGILRAAGVNEVVGVFDMLDALPEKVRRQRLATKRIFESGVRKFHTKEYEIARRRFEKVLSMDPSDACAANCLAETRRRIGDPALPSVFLFDKK